ncbi:DUF2938 domain-containing protein [Pseudoalteromonas maricaloris]|uniref:DUF2938 domain-containing protein n=1 Tax=Pseudoalteromonas maricaloris TaxID=184924 RepID=UPI003C2354B5
MENLYSMLMPAVVIGVGATLVMDLWAFMLSRLFAIKGLDYALVGRWIGHLCQGQLTHQGIGRSKPIFGERVIGWGVHYLIGIVFALVLLLSVGKPWLTEPSLLTALVFGLITCVFPFFIMQPCFGAGIAASKLPEPNKARVKSMAAHLIFGFGLFLSSFIYVSLL